MFEFSNRKMERKDCKYTTEASHSHGDVGLPGSRNSLLQNELSSIGASEPLQVLYFTFNHYMVIEYVQ